LIGTAKASTATAAPPVSSTCMTDETPSLPAASNARIGW
jgi:hypothetical protein